MNRSESTQLNARLANGVMAMLRRRHPPEANLSALDQQALEELIQELMVALSRGETSLSIEADQSKVLERSGWLTASPR